jgi:hypothetical protein
MLLHRLVDCIRVRNDPLLDAVLVTAETTCSQFHVLRLQSELVDGRGLDVGMFARHGLTD